MTGKTEREQEERGLSARHLILIFLAGVAVCGVFFSLGFLVGYNERSSRVTPAIERVTEPSAIPPAVNVPEENIPSASNSPSEAGAAPSPSSSTVSPVGAQGKPAASPARSASKTAASGISPGVSTRATANGQVLAGFTVQVAATHTKVDAQKLVNALKSRGYPVFLVTPEHANANDNLFRVQVGPFPTRGDAENVRGRLSKEGFKPFIRH